MKIKRGSTSKKRLVFIGDSSSTNGAGLANLTYNSAGLVAYYYADDLSDEVQITLASATLGTYTSGGFVAVDNTNMPGWYQFGIPNSGIDGGEEACIQLRGAANMAPVNIYIELDAVDYQTDAFGALKPTTAGRTLDVSAAGNAGIDWSNIEAPTTTVAFTGTTIADTQKVDLNTIKTQAVVCAAGVTMGVYVGQGTAALAVDGSGHVTVGTMGANTVTASALAADAVAEIQSGLSTLTQAQVTGGAYALNSASFAFNAALDFTTTQKAATLARVTLVDTTTTNTDMITAAGIRTAVGMASANLDTQIGTLATAANLATATSYIDTEVAAIKAKTDNLPAAPAATGDCITAAGVRSAVGMASANLDNQLSAIDDYIDTEVAAIKVTTDRLETTWALNSGSYRFTAAALALAPSGSTSVTINPYTATVSGGAVSDSGKLTAYQYADFGPFVITVVDDTGSAIPLNASDLVFVAFDPDGDGTSAYFRITGASGDITVGGAGSNVVTIHQDDTNTSTAMDFAWVLRDTSDDSVVARGNRPISKIEVAADVA